MTQSIRTAQPRVVPPKAGTVAPAAAPGLPTMEVKLSAADGAGLSLVEYDIPGGFSPPPRLHRHTREGGGRLRARRRTPLLVRGRGHGRRSRHPGAASTGCLVPVGERARRARPDAVHVRPGRLRAVLPRRDGRGERRRREPARGDRTAPGPLRRRGPSRALRPHIAGRGTSPGSVPGPAVATAGPPVGPRGDTLHAHTPAAADRTASEAQVYRPATLVEETTGSEDTRP